jgi:hypothetical protein
MSGYRTIHRSDVATTFDLADRRLLASRVVFGCLCMLGGSVWALSAMDRGGSIFVIALALALAGAFITAMEVYARRWRVSFSIANDVLTITWLDASGRAPCTLPVSTVRDVALKTLVLRDRHGFETEWYAPVLEVLDAKHIELARGHGTKRTAEAQQAALRAFLKP